MGHLHTCMPSQVPSPFPADSFLNIVHMHDTRTAAAPPAPQLTTLLHYVPHQPGHPIGVTPVCSCVLATINYKARNRTRVQMYTLNSMQHNSMVTTSDTTALLAWGMNTPQHLGSTTSRTAHRLERHLHSAHTSCPMPLSTMSPKHSVACLISHQQPLPPVSHTRPCTHLYTPPTHPTTPPGQLAHVPLCWRTQESGCRVGFSV